MANALAAHAGAPRQGGGALIIALLVLMQLSVAMLAVLAQQFYAQHQQALADAQALSRVQTKDDVFDDMAQRLVALGTGAGLAQTEQGLAGYASHADEFDCPYDTNTTTRCWRLWVQHEASGAWRERLLYVPDASCGPAYWMQARVVHGLPAP